MAYFKISMGDAAKRSRLLPYGATRGFVGVGYKVNHDLSSFIHADQEDDEARQSFRSVLRAQRSGGGAVAAALKNIWPFLTTVRAGDVVISRADKNSFAVCRVLGDYQYVVEAELDDGKAHLPHRRPAAWSQTTRIDQHRMSGDLRKALSIQATLVDLRAHVEEMDRLCRHLDV